MSELHVVFGTGALGKWTTRELVNMGKRVRVISHSGKADPRLPEGVEIVQGDAYDTQHNIEVTKGATAVYQCAQPLYHEWAEKFPSMQKAILDAVAANGAKFIVGDNLYMYGDTNGQPIREDLPYQPHTKKGRVRGEMSTTIMEAHRSGKIRAAIGRASNFFGPDDTAVTSYAIRPALEGKSINLLGRTDQPHTFSYVADFGKLLATLGTREESLGQIWFTPSPAPITQMELVRIMEEELGHKVKFMAAGKLMLSLLGLFAPTLRESVEMLYEWDKPFIMDSSKAQKAFGFQGTPLRQAMKETVAWIRESK
ncbi:MAG: NAD-dependent epimerase/dehydratase family protein [Chloroflexi bacterium]|nr:NAD-dependent epimerase/dehydratase family protein [Chloroflexota bacterium]